tara:strand:+ start:174 stop:581 length:408 start_codon:yes stop_codon:yes gene_type:complete
MIYCDKCKCNFHDKGLNKVRHRTNRCHADTEREAVTTPAITANVDVGLELSEAERADESRQIARMALGFDQYVPKESLKAEKEEISAILNSLYKADSLSTSPHYESVRSLVKKHGTGVEAGIKFAVETIKNELSS